MYRLEISDRETAGFLYARRVLLNAMGENNDGAAFQSDRGVTAYECSFDGAVPVVVEANDEEEAARVFARDANARGHEVDPRDVEVTPA